MIEIERAIFRYVEAVHYPDDAHRQAAFHDGAVIVGQEDGVLVRTDAAGFLEYCQKLRLPRRRIAESYRIIWTDVQGSVASARVEEYYLNQACVSFLTLTRLNGTWKVICRGFYSGLA